MSKENKYKIDDFGFDLPVDGLKEDTNSNELKSQLLSAHADIGKLKNINSQLGELLETNERILFSKILKLSCYHEVLQNLSNSLETLLNSEIIRPTDLVQLDKVVRTLIDEEDFWEDFQLQFEKVHPNLFKNLNRFNYRFSLNELRHCTYIVLRMRTKEVASMLHVSPRSVETIRYRLKKKLRLAPEENLYDFLQDMC